MSGGVYNLPGLSSAEGGAAWLGRLHPLAKTLVTLFYIVLVVSFSKYNLAGLLLMGIYPAALGWEAGIFSRGIFKLMLPLLLLLMLLSLPNPFLDRSAVFTVKGFTVTGGMISAATLVTKGIFALSASLILAVSTPIEKICYALQMCRTPKILITVILLIFRYIALLADEAGQISRAYALRAPGRKGIHHRNWGSLAGRLLLRSIDRAKDVYDSMLLRGFTGSFALTKMPFDTKSLLYLLMWTAVFLWLRFMPVSKFMAALAA